MLRQKNTESQAGSKHSCFYSFLCYQASAVPFYRSIKIQFFPMTAVGHDCDGEIHFSPTLEL